MGLLNAFGDGLKGLFGEGFADRAAIASALLNGDGSAVASIRASQAKRSQDAADAEAKKQLAMKVYATAVGMGLPSDQAAIMAADPERFAGMIADRNKQPEDPGMIREYHAAQDQHLISPNVGYMDFVQAHSSGATTPVTIPYNSTVTAGGSPGSVSNPAKVTSPAQLNALPDGAQFIGPDGKVRVKTGGPASQAPDGFPNGPYPNIGPYPRY